MYRIKRFYLNDEILNQLSCKDTPPFPSVEEGTMASAGSLSSANRRVESTSSSPGELVLKKLFSQFVVTTEAKLKFVASQALVRERERESV